MPNLYAVYGRLSKNYNHFREYDFQSCEATNTRLMGVLAMRITWVAKDGTGSRYYQIMHLDYSEYGVDDYYEFECIPGHEDFKTEFDDMRHHWHDFTSVMGGKIVKLPVAAMMMLIDEAVPIADNSRPRYFDTEENAEFRTYAVLRLGLMKAALEEAEMLGDSFTDEEVMAMVCPRELATCETINYFLMRLVDLDFHAAGYLSTMSESELRACSLTSPGMQTLMRNQIKQSNQDKDVPTDGMSHPYRCRMTTEANYSYFYSTFVVYLDKDFRFKNPKVTEVRVGTVTKLSEYETAVQLKRTEYITVFDCQDRILDTFDPDRIPFLVGVAPTHVENGWLYVAYNENNNHVNSIDYRLNGDVFGYALLNVAGELVIMSNKIANITSMEQSVLISSYAPDMSLEGRYELRQAVFQTLCQARGYTFRMLLDHGSY